DLQRTGCDNRELAVDGVRAGAVPGASGVRFGPPGGSAHLRALHDRARRARRGW
ncbi:MAG: hypothetical protein AVDCRST_MAG89-2923, partial [uncultured Gemmatimonadetes bacterium]